MEPDLQQRYFELKKQLTNLNYSANFGVDAIEIVQQLFSDLVSTTESYTQLQEKEFNLSQDLSLAQAQLFPLRKENARVTRENQQLHLETIKLREELGDYKDGLNTDIKSLEDEIQQYHYLVLSKDEDLARAEKERVRLREAYEALASSSLLSGGVKVKRSMKMNGSVSSPNAGAVESKSPEQPVSPSRLKSKAMREADESAERSQTDRALAEDLKLISTLQQQVEASQTALKAAKSEAKRLSDALARREEEILKYARKSGTLDATVGSDENRIQNLLAADTSNQRIIEQLNGQVDFLNEHLALRERQLAESGRELAGVRELKSECDHRGALLERERTSNRELVAQLIEMESRISDLQRATDPDTPVSRVSSRGSRLGLQTPPSSSSSAKSHSSISPGLVDRLSNEKNELAEEISRLNSALSSMEEGDSLLRGRLSRTEEAREKLREEMDRVKEENSQLAFSLHHNKTSLDEAVEENKSLRDKLQALQANLEAEAEQADDHKARASHLESQVKILESSKHRLEATVREMKSESSELRKSKSEKSFEAELSGQQLRRWEKEKEHMESLLGTTQKELADVQDSLINVKRERDYLANALSAEVDKANQSQGRIEELLETLDVRSGEMKRLVDANRSLQMQVGEAQYHIQHEESARGGGGYASLQKKNTELEQEYMRLQSDFKSLAQSSSALEIQHQSSSIQIESLVAERDALLRQVADRDNGLDSALRKQRELELENSRLQSQINTSVTSIESVETQRTHHIQKIYEQQQSITELQSELRLAQRRLESFEDATKEASQKVLDAEEIATCANERVKNLESEVTLLKQEIDTLGSEVQVRGEDEMVARSRLEETQRVVTHLKEDLRGALADRDSLQKQTDEYKTILKTMSSTEKDASARVLRSEREVAMVREQMDDMDREISSLKRELNEKNNKIRDLHDSLEALDQDRDALQSQLDNELESDEDRRTVLTQHKQRIEELTTVISHREKQLASVRKECESEHRRAENGTERVRALVDENAELRRRLSMKQNEVGAASEDLLLMTKENQTLTSELAIASDERSKYHKAVIELNEDMAALQQAVRALEIERGDLLETYRSCLQEKRKCEVDLNATSEMKLQLAHTISELRGTITDLNAELSSRKTAETRQLSERSSLLLQLETLNDQLVRASQQTENWESDANRLAQENHSLKQTILTLQQRSVTLVNRAASAADANKILQSRVTSIEREREALRAIVDSERRRSSDMAQLVAMSRSRDAQRDFSPNKLDTVAESSKDRTDRLLMSVASSSPADAPGSRAHSEEEEAHDSQREQTERETYSASAMNASHASSSSVSSMTATHYTTTRQHVTTTTTSNKVTAGPLLAAESNAERLLGISSDDDEDESEK